MGMTDEVARGRDSRIVPVSHGSRLVGRTWWERSKVGRGEWSWMQSSECNWPARAAWGGPRGPDLYTRMSQSWDAGYLAKARTLDKEALYSPRLSVTGMLG